MTLQTIALLVGQAALALAGLWLLRTSVLPAVAGMRHPGLVLDIWGPLALVMPLLGLAVTTGIAVEPGGWAALGGPIVVSWVGLALALIVGRAGESGPAVGTTAIWIATGAVLLLLGASHVMAIWMGQFALAAAAVMLWLLTPSHAAHGQPASRASRTAGLSLFITVLVAIGQAALVAALPPAARPVAGGVAIGYATVGLALTAGQVHGGAALRIGGWAGTYGVLLALGAMSLVHVVPQARAIVVSTLTGEPMPFTVSTSVAFGFGTVAPEATALIALAPAAHVLMARSGRLRIAIACTILVAAATVAGFRLARMIGAS